MVLLFESTFYQHDPKGASGISPVLTNAIVNGRAHAHGAVDVDFTSAHARSEASLWVCTQNDSKCLSSLT